MRRWRASWRALAFLAAGCGGDGDGSASGEDWQIEGLGSTLEEIQAMAKDEGEVEHRPLGRLCGQVWSTSSRKQTGCKVNTKDGANSDDMIDR